MLCGSLFILLFVGVLFWKGRLRSILCISLVSMQRCVILFGFDAEMFVLVWFRCRYVRFWPASMRRCVI